MPLEIRELEINVLVQSPESKTSETTSSLNTDEIIAKCVEQVLEILIQKQER